MNASSTAYILVPVGDKTSAYHFTGVISIEHNLALNLDNTSTQGTDIVNGARNLPDQVTLTVVETDVEHGPGWAAQMLAAMKSVKKNRKLCKVVTAMAAYENMLLTEITAAENEENQFGWSGSLTFVEYVPAVEEKTAATKTNNNSSVRKNTGNTGTKKALSPFQQMLAEAGLLTTGN